MDVSGIVEGGNQFALDLYQQLRTEEGNLFFSPSSISTALAMTYAGAAGGTEAEMATTLHFQMPKDQLHDGMKKLHAFWTTPDKEKGNRLNLANRLWGQESYEFLPEFLRLTRDNYGAELARLNFSESEGARQTINGWVEEQTESKITDLLPVGVLSSDTKLVLTNAVYFHGIWADPFEKEATKDEDFYLTVTDKVPVPMMNRLDEFRFGAIDDLQILELPYGDGNLSMVVLLPKEVDGLADLEAKLTIQNLQRWTESAQGEREVNVLRSIATNSNTLPRNSTVNSAALGPCSGSVDSFNRLESCSTANSCTTSALAPVSLVSRRPFSSTLRTVFYRTPLPPVKIRQ